MLDWFAMGLLVVGYALMARRPRWALTVIVASDILWIVYAAQTDQVPLGLVSLITGALSVRAIYSWRNGARIV